MNYGARNQAGVKNDANKNPENKARFRGNSNQTRMSLYPSSIQTITVGPGVTPDHAYLVILSECEESARGLYRRSGIHLHPCTDVTLPRRLIFSWLDYNIYSADSAPYFVLR